MRLTRLATSPGDRDSASAPPSSKGERFAAVPKDRRLPFDTGVSRAVVSPGTNGSVIRVSRRVASAAIGGTARRTRGDPPRGRIRSVDLGRERSGSRPFVAPATASSRGKTRGPRYDSAATISRALSLSLQSSFKPSLAVRLVRYRNRRVISLGRTSPAAFGLRYKAALLA